jgi:hypothetical protein
MFLCAFIHSCIADVPRSDCRLEGTLRTVGRIRGTVEKNQVADLHKLSNRWNWRFDRILALLVFQEISQPRSALAKFRTGNRSDVEGGYKKFAQQGVLIMLVWRKQLDSQLCAAHPGQSAHSAARGLPFDRSHKEPAQVDSKFLLC